MSKTPSCLRYSIFCLLIAISVFFVSVPLVQAALVDINTAGLEELDTLGGIGPAYAQRIIDYRTANGPFQTIEEIKNVRGIGDTTFLKFKDVITVGFIDSNDLNQNLSDAEDQFNNQMVSSSKPFTNSNNSAHYNSVVLTDYVSNSELEVGAGRKRLGVVGGPMEFKVESNAYSRVASYKWSFGDGASGEGVLVSHTYEYAGDYVVVLNTYSQEEIATSRTDVKIVSFDIAVTAIFPGGIEISNFSTNEINLYGRALVSEGEIFAFPKDTIIKASNKIIFSKKVTSLDFRSIGSISLILIGESGSNRGELEKIKEDYLGQISKMYEQTIAMKDELNTFSKEFSSMTSVSPGSIVQNTKPVEKSQTLLNTETVENVNQANVLDVVPEKTKKVGFLETLKRFFLRKNR